MANTTKTVPFYERYETLLAEGNDLGTTLDTFTIPEISREVRRARFSYGVLIGVDVRRYIGTGAPEDVLVSFTTGYKWIGLYLRHVDGFTDCSSGGMFAVKPDSTFSNRFGLSYWEREHGPLTKECQTGLMELGLGVETTRLFTPD